MIKHSPERKLQKLLDSSPSIRFGDEDRMVIFSDLHLGNGGRKDDFFHNAPLFKAAMENYYMKRGYDLLLNGDVEDLHKFLMKSIARNWTNFN